MAFVLEEESVDRSQQPPTAVGRFVLEEEVKEPTKMQEAKRHISRSLARSLETIGGMPGDIGSIAEMGTEYVLGKIFPTPEEPVPEQAAIEQERQRKVSEARQQLGERGLEDEFVPPPLPKSQDVREITRAITGEYLEPQNRAEKFADEVVSDVTALMLPIGGKFKAVRPILTALGANVAKEVAAEAGVGEKGQFLTKMGTMFLGGMIGKKNIREIPKELYKKADELLPEGATVSASKLGKRVSDLEKILKKGGTSPTKTPVLKKIAEIKKAIKGGEKLSATDAIKQAAKEGKTKLSKQELQRITREQKISLRGLLEMSMTRLIPMANKIPSLSTCIEKLMKLMAL